jgi:DNA invertase Pin-like site-specific DNA recombinase
VKVVAYTRVSTDRQAEHGHGLAEQRKAIREWAKTNGHTLSLWSTDEGVSGSNGLDSRDGLAEALAAIRASKVGGLVVYRLDRLARDLVLQETLLGEVWRMGSRVYSTSPAEDGYLDPDDATSDPSRALIRQILGAVAQYERAMITLRTQAGRRRKASSGGFIGGGVPLGQRVERAELVPDPEGQAAVDRILELHSGGASLRHIAATLSTEGYRPKRSTSGTWHPQSIKLVIERHTAS